MPRPACPHDTPTVGPLPAGCRRASSARLIGAADRNGRRRSSCSRAAPAQVVARCRRSGRSRATLRASSSPPPWPDLFPARGTDLPRSKQPKGGSEFAASGLGWQEIAGECRRAVARGLALRRLTATPRAGLGQLGDTVHASPEQSPGVPRVPVRDGRVGIGSRSEVMSRHPTAALRPRLPHHRSKPLTWPQQPLHDQQPGSVLDLPHPRRSIATKLSRHRQGSCRLQRRQGCLTA